MDPKQMTKQMIDFNKTAFDNTFNAMTFLQDQTEKMVSMYMDRPRGFPRRERNSSTVGPGLQEGPRRLQGHCGRQLQEG